jgi:hypothetical protein
VLIDECRHSVLLQPPEKAYLRRISGDLGSRERLKSDEKELVGFRYSIST